jgi:hypothetical protein
MVPETNYSGDYDYTKDKKAVEALQAKDEELIKV